MKETIFSFLRRYTPPATSSTQESKQAAKQKTKQNKKQNNKIQGPGPRETAQQLRVLGTLREDMNQFSAPTCWLTTVCNSSSRGSNAPFKPPQALNNMGALT